MPASIVLRGIGAAPGVGFGQAQLWAPLPTPGGATAASAENWAPDNVRFDQILTRYREAVARVSAELSALERDVAERAGPEAGAILGAQALIAQDPELAAAVEERVREGKPLDAAIREAGEAIATELAGLDDEYLRQRATDVRDVVARLAGACLPGSDRSVLSLDFAATVLVASDVAPATLARLDLGRLDAIVTSGGSATSHLALLARGLGVPVVVGCADALAVISEGDWIGVDGATGEVNVRPEPELEQAQRAHAARVVPVDARVSATGSRPTLTADGRRIILAANVGSAREARLALAAGAEGVGLFRTEFLFMGRTALPSEEEQYDEYRAVAELMAPHRVTIRTLDVGGDKQLPALPLPNEVNPFLGWRGIRLWLDRPDLAGPQVRAILRAARHGFIDLLLPMVVDPAEVRRARQIIASEAAALGDNAGTCRLGIMVEVPATALTIETFVPDVEFFSIGTNDLTMYTLAAERGNPRVASLYDAGHPAVLRLIRLTVEAAHAGGKPVAVCGDAASDPRLIPALIALGVDELSMPPDTIAAAREQIRGLGTGRPEQSGSTEYP